MSAPLMSTKEVAKYLGVHHGSLRSARCRNTSLNIPYVTVGRVIRYRPEDVEAFVKANEVNPGALTEKIGEPNA